MTAKHREKEVKPGDLRELKDALAVTRLACARLKSKVAYASNLYDAAEDVIHACEQLAKETGHA